MSLSNTLTPPLRQKISFLPFQKPYAQFTSTSCGMYLSPTPPSYLHCLSPAPTIAPPPPRGPQGGLKGLIPSAPNSVASFCP